MCSKQRLLYLNFRMYVYMFASHLLFDLSLVSWSLAGFWLMKTKNFNYQKQNNAFLNPKM